MSIDDPKLLAFSERAARHHFEQRAVRSGGVIGHFDADCFRFAEIALRGKLVIDFRFLHGQLNLLREINRRSPRLRAYLPPQTNHFKRWPAIASRRLKITNRSSDATKLNGFERRRASSRDSG